MKNLKEKLDNNKTLKYSLFFGFYLIFFILLFIYMRNNNFVSDTKEEKEEVKEEININNPLNKLLNNNFNYEIIIKDDHQVITFNGLKDNPDYNDYEYKYFLDIYNINQLIKRSKLIRDDNNSINYEISNLEISGILNTIKEEGINNIDINIIEGNITEINLDLHNYLDKEEFIINYKIGDNNE